MNKLKIWLITWAAKRLINSTEVKLMLSGYKTYICMILIGLAGIAFSQGYITKEVFMIFESILLPAAGLSLRAGIKKSGPKDGG